MDSLLSILSILLAFVLVGFLAIHVLISGIKRLTFVNSTAL